VSSLIAASGAREKNPQARRRAGGYASLLANNVIRGKARSYGYSRYGACIFKLPSNAYNRCMSQRILDNLQRWARAWNIAGAHLASERAAGLRSMTDDEARKIIARIFSGPMPARIARESGLLEQQRLFRQLK